MKAVSLKYRIALVILTLEMIMMGVMLGPMMSLSQKEAQEQIRETEKVIIEMLNSYSRTAMFTQEYDDIQTHFESLGNDPSLKSIDLINNSKIIVASSAAERIGEIWTAEDALNASNYIPVRNSANIMGALSVNFSQKGINSVIERTRDRSIVIAAAGMSVIAGVGLLTGFLLTRRLNILAGVAREVSEGNLSARSSVSGHDEIGVLSSTFNRMASSIQENIDKLRHREHELEQAGRELESRVKERTQELEVARDAALESSRVKSAFLANMSHELRTPLNAIIGYAEIIGDELDSPSHPEAAEDVSKIITSSTHLLNLINNILDLSKIESGKMEVYLERFDLGTILDDSCTTASAAIKDNNNQLEINLPAETIQIISDLTKLRQVIINLLSNAAKFTQDGKIIITAIESTYKDQPGVTISIRDTGIGMNSEQQKIVFEEFSQADASTTRKYGGTGLGLTLSKRFVETLGGYISVDSEEGKGSEFHIWIPLESPAAQSRATG